MVLNVGCWVNMAGLKLIFCQSINKGWRVGWGGGGGFSLLGGSGTGF